MLFETEIVASLLGFWNPERDRSFTCKWGFNMVQGSRQYCILRMAGRIEQTGTNIQHMHFRVQDIYRRLVERLEVYVRCRPLPSFGSING